MLRNLFARTFSRNLPQDRQGASTPDSLFSSKHRLVLIDGLRGIAAMAVVFYHLYGNIRLTLSFDVPVAVDWLLMHGYLGVAIFFVLSGYVITLNIGRAKITPGFMWRFALRRAIRLDPPYWLSIAAAIALTFAAAHAFPELEKTYPSVRQVLAHLVYLQGILGFQDIVPIYWTLTFEVQFYLFILVLLFAAQVTLKVEDAPQSLAFPVVAGMWLLLAALSLAQFFDWVEIAPRGTFLPYWYCFSLGMFCVWAVSDWLKLGWFAVHWSLVLFCSIAGGWNETGIVVVITGALLLVAGKKGKLHIWTLGRAMQYLGRISYSLYLFHGIVGWSTVSLLKRWTGTPLGMEWAGVVFVGGLLASIASAHIVYLLVERPSIALSRRIRLRRG